MCASWKMLGKWSLEEEVEDAEEWSLMKRAAH
jgi:hypothetical protein